MKLQNYRFDNGIIGGVPDIYEFLEREDGLHVIHERKKVDKQIGNFVLRPTEPHDNYNDGDLGRLKYNFDVYIVKDNIPKNIKIPFYIYEDEKASTMRVAARIKGAAVLFRDKVSLEYFNYYVWYLICGNIKLSKPRVVYNEETATIVKEYLVTFFRLIQGKENLVIENSFDYREEENCKFYNENNINDNKDLYLHMHFNDKNYQKIGYEQDGLYFIHLQDLIQFMESENRFPKKLKAETINIGLHKLDLTPLEEGKTSRYIRSRNKKYPMNVTIIFADKLKELAFPASEVESEEETPNDTVPNALNDETPNNIDDDYDDDYDYDYDDGWCEAFVQNSKYQEE